jgi:hypothetical protein
MLDSSTNRNTQLASGIGGDQDEEVVVNGSPWSSSKVARRRGSAGVLSSRWRKKKTISSFPSRNGIPGRAG